MLMSLLSNLRTQKWPEWTANAFALLGLLVYVAQSILFAHTTISSLDEGGYLYKGLLFAEGVYRPFQPYGFWTNKAPLAFLIPGYVQVLFGAGLRVGRYLSVLEGVLALLGMWIASNRIGGKKLAAIAVWGLALSPAVIKVYSVGASQSLVACFVAWILALSLGEKRPMWQLILSSVLTSLMILARQNMVAVLPIILLYIFWQHGWKSGLWSSIAGVLVFVIGHMIYWPGIIQLWLPWIPAGIPELDVYRISAGGQASWKPIISWDGRLLSVFQGVRWHFMLLSGIGFSIFLWGGSKKWNDKVSFRAMIFLAVLFISLLILHSYAALDKSYCVYCFAPYLSFFNVVGIILLVVLARTWNERPVLYNQILIVVFVLLIAAGVGFSTFEDTGKWLLSLPSPRLNDGRILPGFTTIGELFFNKFAFEQNVLKKLASTGMGLVFGVVLVTSVYFFNIRKKYNYGYVLANTSLAVGLLLSPWMAGSQGGPDCTTDVILANEEMGAYLARVIPAGSTVYWDGGLSVAPLLYAPQAQIYPPQVNGVYGYRNGGDSDLLLQYGYWNDDLARLWKADADFILIEEWRYSNWKPFLTPDRFAELPRTETGSSCLELTRLRIFKRLP